MSERPQSEKTRAREPEIAPGVRRGSRPGYRPWSCGDRAGVLPAPAGGVVVVVGCTVFHMWRGVVLRALQVRVLRAPAVAGHAAVLDPLNGVQSCTLGGPGDTWSSRTPRGGRSGTPAASDGHPSSRGPWRHRTSSQAGGGLGAIRIMRWSPDGRSWQNSAELCRARLIPRHRSHSAATAHGMAE